MSVDLPELKKKKPGPRPFRPTPEERKQVEALAGYGVPQEQIASLVRHGISVDTLVVAFKAELTAGCAKANAEVGKTFFQRARSGEDTAAMIWWTKSRMRWRSAQEVVVTTPQQHPTIDLSKVPPELLIQLRDALNTPDADTET